MKVGARESGALQPGFVECRPDFVQSRALKAKQRETIVTQLQAGTQVTDLAEDELIVLHQTATPPGPVIGSTLNLFMDTKEQSKPHTAAHYLEDIHGFVVKLANENIAAVHAGGPGGDAWGELISRTATSQKAGDKPKKTINSFANITIGIEHVHGLPSNPFPKKPRDVLNAHPTKFDKRQMDASADLVRQLRGTGLFGLGGTDNIVTHNQIAISLDNRVGRFKPHCPGSGYAWKNLEDQKFARKTRFSYVFKTAAEKAIDSFLGSSSTKVIDTSADGRGHIKRLQEALSAIGYMVPVLSDKYIDLRDPLRAFMLRHFSGPSRTGNLARVMDGDSGEPKANRLLVETILASEEDL